MTGFFFFFSICTLVFFLFSFECQILKFVNLCGLSPFLFLFLFLVSCQLMWFLHWSGLRNIVRRSLNLIYVPREARSHIFFYVSKTEGLIFIFVVFLLEDDVANFIGLF